MKIKNKILQDTIRMWICVDPRYKNTFSVFKPLIEVGDIISGLYDFTPEELSCYIHGIILWEFFLHFEVKDKDKEFAKKYSDKLEELINPVLDKIIEHVKSDSYQNYIIEQQITNKAVINIDGVIEPIDTCGIKLHARRKAKFMVTIKDVEFVQKDLIQYLRNLYRDPHKTSKYQTDLDVDCSTINGKYNSDLIFKHFNRYLNTTIDVFNSWLLFGAGNVEQIKWKYAGGNKAQLRAFLNEICNVKMPPKEINVTFQLKTPLNSNDRAGQLDAPLKVLLEKCRK